MKRNLLPLFCLLAVLLWDFAPTALNAQTYFSESFDSASGTTPPKGWSINMVTGNAAIDKWRFNNPAKRYFGKSISGAPFAIFDNSYNGDTTAKVVELISPTIDLTGKNIVSLAFYEYLEGGFGGKGQVYFSADNGKTWQGPIYSASTTSISNPNKVSINVAPYSNNSSQCKVKFVYSGNSSFWWIIDDVILYKTPAKDAAALLVKNLPQGCVIDLKTPLTVTAKNMGSGNISAIRMNYVLNNGPVVSEQDSLLSIWRKDSLITYTFKAKMPLRTGVNLIKVFTSLPDNVVDGFTPNDTIYVKSDVHVQQVANIPFSDDFEDTVMGASWCAHLSSSGNGRVEIMDTTTVKPCSGNRMLVMDANKPASTIDNLDLLVNLSSCAKKTLSFIFGNMNDEQDIEDGLYLSVNNGGSFTKIFTFDMKATNGKCQLVKINLDSLATALKITLSSTSVLRWTHAGNNTITSGKDGFYLDRVRIDFSRLSAVDVRLAQVISPTASPSTDTTVVKIKFVNNGNDTLVSLNLNYRYGNNPVVTEFWGGCMKKGDSAIFIFVNKLVTKAFNQKLCIWTSKPNNQADIFPSNDSICFCYNYTLAITKKDVSCNGAGNGSVSLKTNGGTPPFTFQWSNGSTSQNLYNLAPGTYSVFVKDSNMCTSGASLIINEPAAITAVVNTTFATCGAANGSASVTVNGGTPPYTYLWSNGEKTSSISNVAAGVYTLNITDANACSKLLNVTVSNLNGATVTYTSKNVSCNGGNNGSISLQISGGRLPYTILWQNGDTSRSITSLIAGNYAVSVSDSSGCKTVLNINIRQPMPLTIATSETDASCGAANGVASAMVSGGTPPYVYSWSNGMTTSSISGVPSGSYVVTVTDSAGCMATANVAVSNAGAPLIVPFVKNVSCYGANNGSISLTIGGGFPPYTYLWSTGDRTKNIGGLKPGSYTVTVSDSNGCKSIENFNITQPDSITILLSAVGAHAGLKDGSAWANISGGTPPYHILWSNGSGTDTIINLQAGTYSATVTDAHGCSKSGSVYVSGNTGITPLHISNLGLHVYPNPTNGRLTLELSGSTDLPIMLSLSNILGETMISRQEPKDLASDVLDISHLPAGIYYLKVQSGDYYAFEKIVLQK